MIEFCRYGIRYGRAGFATILPWPHVALFLFVFLVIAVLVLI
jgi:hypothetical protein